MTLYEYLQMDGALSVSELRQRMANFGSLIKSDAQIRQWQHQYADRIPSPVNCVAIEHATNGQVTRKDLRPHDWASIWPELASQPHRYESPQPAIDHPPSGESQ
jgi:DNA-binding transcriptional regulator YdaS (Cro superfamily)